MKSKLTIEDARELARRAYAMARAAKSGDCGKQTGDFMWLLFTLAGVRGTENIIEEIRAAKKVKPLAKGHADGKVTIIHITDEWADAGPKPTPPREIIPDLKPGDMVVFASQAGVKAYGTKPFFVESIWEPFAMIVDASRERHMLIEKRHLRRVKDGGKEQ